MDVRFCSLFRIFDDFQDLGLDIRRQVQVKDGQDDLGTQRLAVARDHLCGLVMPWGIFASAII